MTSPRATEIWKTWREEAKRDAEARWSVAESATHREMKGEEWHEKTRARLMRLERMKILAAREQVRLTKLPYDALAPADKRRLDEAGHRRHLYIYGVKRLEDKRQQPDEDQVPLWRNALQLNDGKRLCEGRLSLQVFVDDAKKMPVGMSVQLRGQDPARSRPVYLRYDLDVVPLGSGPVTHFSSHWHAGDDPDAKDAEDHDPRLPALILDPLAVIDILVETFWPGGPADVEDS